ncbi:MAG: hypothetical protein CSB24_00025 [Deltaproteobacteria bacterium]|nr:MAG: hypothetical protein CSB24_00025 [Deltaproteobacteria bacterium]
MEKFHSCVSPAGKFIYGIHKPCFEVDNFRESKIVESLGCLADGSPINNQDNYPDGTVKVAEADWIFEIPNPLTFRGATFINKKWADAACGNSEQIRIKRRPGFSLSAIFRKEGVSGELIQKLPDELLLAIATGSSDPEDLQVLAELSACFQKDSNGNPAGLCYRQQGGRVAAEIKNHLLFEAAANNPNLPDEYKKVMVLRPGVQGKSEIVGEYQQDETGIYEYMRKNSYIPGGHYAANMSEKAVRYSIGDLSFADIRGLRHLYYQRTYTRLARLLGIALPEGQRRLEEAELETLRQQIQDKITQKPALGATLWGWNFGFDYAPTGYRLHASHQQIHQQYAMIPERIEAYSGSLNSPEGSIPSYGCGDLVARVIDQYQMIYQADFFTDYRKAIFANQRMDERCGKPSSLIVWQDERVILFVPKAQTSQWELQIMTIPDQHGRLVGNIAEADAAVRKSLDTAILYAQKALYERGAEMVTSIEYPKRLNNASQAQPLIYCLLPRLPESPGAFSEAQHRYINGHYPEDFAEVCRQALKKQGY